MASIRKEVVLAAPMEAVWDALQDVGALHTRLVPGFVVDTQLEPGARVVTFNNGQVLRELIVDVSHSQRRVAWAIHDGPFQHYSASAQVFPRGGDGCHFIWTADLLPDEFAGHVSSMMDQGIAAMEGVFGKPIP